MTGRFPGACRGSTRGTVISRAFASRGGSPVAEAWVARAGSGGSPTPGVLEPACHEQPSLAVEAVGSRATWRRTPPRRTATARPPERGSEPEVWRDRPDRMRRRRPHRRSGSRRADPAGASAQSHAGRADTRHRARRSVQSCFGSRDRLSLSIQFTCRRSECREMATAPDATASPLSAAADRCNGSQPEVPAQQGIGRHAAKANGRLVYLAHMQKQKS